jgi:polyketide cyclase/dehydrase/lipid transport protein
VRCTLDRAARRRRKRRAPLQVPNPHYVTVNESTVVNAPVDKVWARVGKFCDITEWMNSPEWEDCKYLQGDGSPGSVRSIVDEVIFGPFAIGLIFRLIYRSS